VATINSNSHYENNLGFAAPKAVQTPNCFLKASLRKAFTKSISSFSTPSALKAQKD
jgi:hypothetical protein